MNAINSALIRLFDVLLVPLEALGDELALILVSGVFGILALLIFKRISNQRGIKAAKNKIKGHMIEIRLYQDDLGIVARAIGKVLLRNFQYLAYNFGPFLPLAVPFVFIVAQMVVRYAFEPAPVQVQTDELLAGAGTTLAVELDAGRRADVAGLEVVLPDGLVALSPLVRAPSRGRAFQEFAARIGGLTNPPADPDIGDLVATDGGADEIGVGQRVLAQTFAELREREEVILLFYVLRRWVVPGAVAVH